MSRTPRADLWFAIVLTLLGVGIVAESLRMPRLQNLGVHPMSAPGLTPGVLGTVLAALGLALLVRSARAGPAPVADRAGGWGGLLTTLALCLGYAAGLIGRVPFWAATAIFVAAFVLTFTWRPGARLRAVAAAGLLAIGVAAGVTALFQEVFLVRLP